MAIKCRCGVPLCDGIISVGIASDPHLSVRQHENNCLIMLDAESIDALVMELWRLKEEIIAESVDPE